MNTVKNSIPGEARTTQPTLPVFSKDPIEAAKTHARFMKGEWT